VAGNRPGFVFCLFLLCMCQACAVSGVGPTPAIENASWQVEPIRQDGRYVGFQFTPLNEDAGNEYRIDLSIAGNLTAGRAQRGVNGRDVFIRLTDLLSDPTPEIAGGYVTVTLLGEDPYPRVDFELDIGSFDAVAWKSVHGEVPFHFLSCSLPGAEVFSQRGWPIGTPDYDPYNMKLAEGPGRSVVSSFSRDWANTPPIGGYPFPVVGLWKPTSSAFLCYDFHGPRLTDHSEKYIASTYCYSHKNRKVEAFTLAWPHGGQGYQNLVFPEKPEKIVSWFRVLHKTGRGGLGLNDDPNMFVTEWLWKTYADLLPRAPAMNDMDWLPENLRFSEFGKPGIGGLYGPEGKPRWFTPDSIDAYGIGDDVFCVEYAYRNGNQGAIDELHRRLDWLREHAKRFKVGDEDCVFWEKPIIGEGAEFFGPGVRSLHNVGGWGIALAMLEVYRNEGEKKAELLQDVDGALRWTRHMLYSRNCYPDVPAAEFAWSAGPATTFCLRYYYTFRDDPQRHELAQLAYRLAQTMLYRYMAIWTSDSDDSDADDSSFMMEPNAGAPWCACACANEIWVMPKPLVNVYVATGDEVLAYYLRGMMDKFHEIVQNVTYPTIREYPSSSYSERLGLFPGCPQGDGIRGDFGGLWGGGETVCWPPGEATMRIVCGEKGAIAFCRDGAHSDISDYAAGKGGSCKFKVVKSGTLPAEGKPGAICVSVPFFNMTGKPVSRIRDDKREAISDIVFFDTRNDSLIVRDVRQGDVIVIGEGPFTPVEIRRLRPRLVETEPVLASGDFRMVSLGGIADTGVDTSWAAANGYGGLWTGMRWVAGVPFNLADPTLNSGKGAVRNRGVPVGNAAGTVFALIGDHDEKGQITLKFRDGTSQDFGTEKAVPFIVGWPACYTWHLDLLTMPARGMEVGEVTASGAAIFAISFTDKSLDELPQVSEVIAQRLKIIEGEREAARRIARIAPLFEKFSGHIAVLPIPGDKGPDSLPLYRTFMRAGLQQHLRMLTAPELVDPTVFNKDNFPVALYLHAEEYVDTVNEPGDAVKSLQRYLSEGGTLAVLPSGPFPFYYPMKPNEEQVKGVANGSACAALGYPVCGSGIGGRNDTIPNTKVIGWEAPPEGLQLTLKVRDGQDVVKSLPAAFAIPADGDKRWRPVAGILDDSADYTPLITLYDASGTSYGDAAVWIRHKTGKLAGGTVVGAWATLSRDPEIGSLLNVDILSAALERAAPPVARFSCSRAAGKIQLDGRLSERAWASAPAWGFTCFGNRTGEPPIGTKARALWDDKGLYFAFECDDPDIHAAPRGHDGFLWEGEVVEVYIDPDGDGRDYCEFEISPRGETIDLKIPSPKDTGTDDLNRANAKWETPGWSFGVNLDGTLDNRDDTDKGWTVETFIPWTALPGALKPRVGGGVRFNLYRIERAKTLGDEPMLASLVPTDTFHAPERFAKLVLAGNPYDEDFSTYPDGPFAAPHWKSEAGKWTISGGLLIGENSGTDGFVPAGLKSVGTPLTDFDLSVEFRIASRGKDHRDGCWIGFRDAGPGVGYSLNFQGGRIWLMKRNQGRSCDDGTQMAEIGDWQTDDKWHKAEISAKGNAIAIRLDDKLIFDVRDEGHLGVPPVLSGGISLSARKWSMSPGDTRVEFRSVKVGQPRE